MRLIDADEILKDKVSNAYISRFEIENAPTAEVQEVRHAHWIPKSLGNCECSNCHEEYGICGGLLGDYNYCPNCGAKMDGKENKRR